MKHIKNIVLDIGRIIFDDSKKNLSKSYPLITTNFEYIKTLKKQGYKLYLLTNITKESYNYINDL